jgi:membrane protein
MRGIVKGAAGAAWRPLTLPAGPARSASRGKRDAVKGFLSLIKETAQAWSADKASMYAAVLSFYTLLALAPLLIIAVSIAGLVYGSGTARESLLTQVHDRAGAQVADAVATVLTNAHRPGASIAGLVIGGLLLMLGASGAVSTMHTALNAMWDVRPAPVQGLLRKIAYAVRSRLFYFAVVLLIGLILLSLVGVGAAWTWIAHRVGGSLPASGVLLRVADFFVALVLLTVLFALLFRFLSDATPKWSDLWFGSFITALLFDVGRLLITLYLAKSTTTSSFGAAGSVVALLLWMYYSAMIVFFGVEFTQVYARRRGRVLTLKAGATMEPPRG